jgi:hypothetical protein
MVTEPEELPVTIPVEEPTDARVPLLLDHTPPGALLVRVTVLPIHTLVAPDIAAIGLTVTVLTTLQPDPIP